MTTCATVANPRSASPHRYLPAIYLHRASCCFACYSQEIAWTNPPLVVYRKRVANFWRAANTCQHLKDYEYETVRPRCAHHSLLCRSCRRAKRYAEFVYFGRGHVASAGRRKGRSASLCQWRHRSRPGHASSHRSQSPASSSCARADSRSDSTVRALRGLSIPIGCGLQLLPLPVSAFQFKHEWTSDFSVVLPERLVRS